MESALAAINAGADALYLGGKNFSARSSAQNFTPQELEELIAHAAIRRVRTYVAVNTLYKNTEIPQVVDFVSQTHRAGAAAFILQDPGLAYILRSKFPHIEIHASTQMSVHSTQGVHFMEKMGFSRVVLSRELSLDEIGDINAAANIETEVFVHGALCVSYSGQCLMSSLIGGRSGNRGKCAQICRTRFALAQNGKAIKNGHLLSPKDMMTLDILPQIIDSGVASLKIEGRMKSPEYVYLVTKAYRDKLDHLYQAPSPEERDALLQIFNRGGCFTTGYYHTHSGAAMMSPVTPKSTGVLAGKVVAYARGKCHIQFTKAFAPGDGLEIWATKGDHVGTGVQKHIKPGETAVFHISGGIEKGNLVYKSHDKYLVDRTKKSLTIDKQTHILAQVDAVEGLPIQLTLSHTPATEVVVQGNVVQPAKQAPMGEEDIIAQLSKTGGTPFQITFTHANVGDNIFVSKSELNQLRRTGLDMLEKSIFQNLIPPAMVQDGASWEDGLIKAAKAPAPTAPRLHVEISDPAYLPTVLAQGVHRVYVPYHPHIGAPLLQPTTGTEIFVALPHITRNLQEAELANTLATLENTPITGYLVSTYGQLQLLQGLGTKKQLVLNHNFNIFNSWAVAYFTGQNLTATLSQELNIKEIKALETTGQELIVYGRQRVMATHNCPIGNFVGNKAGKGCNVKTTQGYTLIDKMGMHFPIQTDCKHCTAYILNCKTLDTAPKCAQLHGLGDFRLIFTTEPETDIASTIARYQHAIAGAEPDTALGKDTTHGHFFRGVE